MEHEHNDEALFLIDLKTDLKPVFNWNVKLLFVYLSAEYTTKTNALNQVVIWDTIIERTELGKTQRELDAYSKKMKRRIYHLDGKIDIKDLRNKYGLIDDEHNLRNANLTFKLNWNVVPYSGLLFDQSQTVIDSYVLPSTYQRAKRGENYRTQDEIY